MNPEQWLDTGIAIIPCRYRSKRPVFQWRKYQTELPTKDDLRDWFKSRFVNTAVITGWEGLAIIDFDDWQTWQVWRNWITTKYPNLLNTTYQVKTSRGMHVYFLINNPPERTLRLPKIDVKAAGGYALCPNSIHPNGHQYRANMDGLKIARIDCLEDVLPSMLLAQSRQDIVIPEFKPVQQNGDIDIWNITPQSENGCDSIDWIKQNRHILEFFPDAVKTGNDWWMVHCPIHDDHERSASICYSANRIKCFKNCFGNRGTDVIDFYCILKKCDRKQAIRELAASCL